jgi:peptidoglycan/xylan/chitin deacetylase (PgdA/CDA1 family)
VDAFVAGRALRVVNYHSTPQRLAHVVEEEARDYAARYDVLDPAGLARLLATGEWTGERPPLVVALFDGFRNNATVALPALERAGVTAWLHLPTDFLEAAPEDQPGVAVRDAIRVAPEEVAAGERLAMTWDEVAAAAERHAVGAHTATHTTAAAVRDPAAVEREVVRPLRQVAAVTGRPADAFAFLGGTPWDAASDAGRAARDEGAAWWVSGLAYERLGRR